MSKESDDEDMDGIEDINVNQPAREPGDIDVMSICLELFTDAITDAESEHHEMANYLNDYPIIFDRFNELVGTLFEMELNPSTSDLVTHDYIRECIFDNDNYMFAEYIATSSGFGNKDDRKQRSAERGKSQVSKARDRYLCGVTNRRILEHALEGGIGAPSDPTSHEGQRFTSMYGLPWPIFNELSNEFESWCTHRNESFYIKELCPFKLRTMACFRQLRTGGSLDQFRKSHSIVGSVFRKFFYMFLDWHWDIRHTHIQLPKTRQEIAHVENLYRLMGYPGCLGSIDCVHVPWGACTWTLQTQCINKTKGKPSVVFEVISSHTTKILHVSDMFWGACGDSLIVKYDAAVHEIMDGRYSLLPFEVKDKFGNIVRVYGFYYICDGGYPKFKYLVCPFKWPQIGSDMAYWSDSVEAARKDIERCFGSMKKRFRILVSPITLTDAFRVEQVFIACCVLHNRLLDYNGGDNWRHRTVPVAQKGEQEQETPIIIENDHSFLRSAYRNDEEFQSLLQQNMEFPSHELRAIERQFTVTHSSSIEMVTRLNQLQEHYVRLVKENGLMKLKKMADWDGV